MRYFTIALLTLLFAFAAVAQEITSIYDIQYTEDESGDSPFYVNLWLHETHQGSYSRRKQRAAGLPVRSRQEPELPLPFCLAEKLGRNLGQPLYATLCAERL